MWANGGWRPRSGSQACRQVRLTWRPFELNPDMPAEGMARKDYRAAKFGAARSIELDQKMTQTGREVGISFAFDRIERTPSTRLAHRLIWEAERQGRQDEVVSGCCEPISRKPAISARPMF